MLADGVTCQKRSRWLMAHRGLNASAAMLAVASEFPQPCGAATCATEPPRRRLGFVFACSRGSATSVYDYAEYAESLLNLPRPLLVCVAAAPAKWKEVVQQYERFRKRFGDDVIRIGGWNHSALPAQVDELACRHGITDLYWQKAGKSDGVLSRLPQVRNLVHAVFDARQPHGTAYAAVSPSVRGACPEAESRAAAPAAHLQPYVGTGPRLARLPGLLATGGDASLRVCVPPQEADRRQGRRYRHRRCRWYAASRVERGGGADRSAS